MLVSDVSHMVHVTCTHQNVYVISVVWLSGGWAGFHLRSCVVFVHGCSCHTLFLTESIAGHTFANHCGTTANCLSHLRVVIAAGFVSSLVPEFQINTSTTRVGSIGIDDRLEDG